MYAELYGENVEKFSIEFHSKTGLMPLKIQIKSHTKYKSTKPNPHWLSST